MVTIKMDINYQQNNGRSTLSIYVWISEMLFKYIIFSITCSVYCLLLVTGTLPKLVERSSVHIIAIFFNRQTAQLLHLSQGIVTKNQIEL